MSKDTMTTNRDMMQGLSGTADVASQGLNTAKDTAGALRTVARGARRSSSAGGKGARAIGRVLPLKVKVVMAAIVALLLVIVIVITLSSNAQTRRLSYLTPKDEMGAVQNSSETLSSLTEEERSNRLAKTERTVTRKTGSTYTNATYDGPEYESQEELDKLLYDKNEIVNDSKALLLEVVTAKAENRIAIQQEAIKAASNLNPGIDLSVTASSVKFEKSNAIEIVGSDEVSLLRISGGALNGYQDGDIASKDTALVSIAQNETGKEDPSKYWKSIAGSNYINGTSTPWHASFVSWCLKEAGIPEDIIKRDVNADLGWAKYKDTPYAHIGASDYTPVPGDIVSWLWPEDEEKGLTRSHVGIVASFSGRTLVTIEGNADPERPIKRTWTLSEDGITAHDRLGFSGKIYFLHLPLHTEGELSLSDKISANVLKYKSEVQAECNANGISDYWPYLLAIMQAETGGLREDIMQSSESLGLPPNTLTRRESIKQGVKAFASALRRAQNNGITDIETVIQAYNYGPGFCDYVASNGGKYTFELAEQFSLLKAGSDRKIPYVNAISTARGKEYRYGYGNFHYVDVVKQYLNGSLTAPENVTTISKKDYQLLAAYSIMLGNGQTIKDQNGEILNQEGIPLKRNWNILSLFDGTFGQIDYIKTLRSAIRDLVDGTGLIFKSKGEGFYTYEFVKNEDGGYLFYGEREVTEWRWYTEDELKEHNKEEDEEEESSSPKPRKPRILPGDIEYAVGSPSTIEAEENMIPGETGEYVTRVETYSYMKPIIKERPLKDVVATLFKLDVNAPYIGSMTDSDGDGFVNQETGNATIREAIYTLAEQTFALLTNDGRDVQNHITTGGILGCPLNPGTYKITSYFGYRPSPVAGASTNHDAIDVYLPEGTPIVSAEEGTVIAASVDSAGGLFIKIKHDNGYETWYWHLSSHGVSAGERVTRGQQIGLSGNTGLSTGPHLHFGVFDPSGRAVDPLPLLGQEDNATHLVVKEVSLAGSGVYAAPLSPGTYRFSQDFGRTSFSSFHNGIDIACGEGTAVYAVSGGTVIMSGYAADYGIKFPDGTLDTAWGVKVKQDDGLVCYYWHLKKNSTVVSVGERIEKGQKLGLSGNTGLSTGPHLHLELRSGNTPVDPKPYLGITEKEGKDIRF